jgi:hypothetical protein
MASVQLPLSMEASPPLCHPERSRGICSSLNQHPIRTEAPPSPLSPRPERSVVDLQFSQPASDSHRSTALPLSSRPERSVVEGSAVLLTGQLIRPEARRRAIESGAYVKPRGGATDLRVPHPSRCLRRVGYNESRCTPLRIPPLNPTNGFKDGAPTNLLHCRPHNIKPGSQLLSARLR